MWQLCFLSLIVLTACSDPQASQNDSLPIETLSLKVPHPTSAETVALTFINDYKTAITQENFDILNWTSKYHYVTTDFRSALKSMLEDADPEIGLGFDPIFDAQDFPESRFKEAIVDENQEYAIVKGTDWEEFEVVIKTKKENGEWKVDGAGVVNIPQDKQAKR